MAEDRRPASSGTRMAGGSVMRRARRRTADGAVGRLGPDLEPLEPGLLLSGDGVPGIVPDAFLCPPEPALEVAALASPSPSALMPYATRVTPSGRPWRAPQQAYLTFYPARASPT